MVISSISHGETVISVTCIMAKLHNNNIHIHRERERKKGDEKIFPECSHLGPKVSQPFPV